MDNGIFASRSPAVKARRHGSRTALHSLCQQWKRKNAGLLGKLIAQINSLWRSIARLRPNKAVRLAADRRGRKSPTECKAPRPCKSDRRARSARRLHKRGGRAREKGTASLSPRAFFSLCISFRAPFRAQKAEPDEHFFLYLVLDKSLCWAPPPPRARFWINGSADPPAINSIAAVCSCWLESRSRDENFHSLTHTLPARARECEPVSTVRTCYLFLPSAERLRARGQWPIDRKQCASIGKLCLYLHLNSCTAQAISLCHLRALEKSTALCTNLATLYLFDQMLAQQIILTILAKNQMFF